MQGKTEKEKDGKHWDKFLSDGTALGNMKVELLCLAKPTTAREDTEYRHWEVEVVQRRLRQHQQVFKAIRQDH